MEVNSQILFLFFLQATINGVNISIAQTPSNKAFRCTKTGRLSSSSLQNRDITLDSLISNIVNNPRYTGYVYTHSSSGKPDRVNAAVLCPPNIKPENCAKCISETIPYLKQNCLNQKEGVAWTVASKFINCMVRYADYEFEGSYKFWDVTYFSSPNASARALDLGPAVAKFGKELSEKAARGDKIRKYESGKQRYAYDTNTIYMAVQCTPDLDYGTVYVGCFGCLTTAMHILKDITNSGRVSARAVTQNCYARYDHVPVSP